MDWKKNQDWVGMLKNSKMALERLTIAEAELQLDVMSNFLLHDSDSTQKVGSRIFLSILTKTAVVQGYSLIVNVEAAAFHILYLLEKASLTPVHVRSHFNSITPGKHRPS
jgi:hypothetical protein